MIGEKSSSVFWDHFSIFKMRQQKKHPSELLNSMICYYFLLEEMTNIFSATFNVSPFTTILSIPNRIKYSDDIIPTFNLLKLSSVI